MPFLRIIKNNLTRAGLMLLGLPNFIREIKFYAIMRPIHLNIVLHEIFK